MDIYKQLKDDDGYRQSVSELRQLIDKYGMKDLKVGYYKHLYLSYKDKGDKDSTNKYEIEYLKAKDALATESRLQAVGEMHFLTALQEANDKVRVLAAKHLQQQIIIILCIALFVLAACSSVYFVRKNKDLRRKQQALYDKMQESLQNDKAAPDGNADNKTLQKYQNSKLAEQDKRDIYERIMQVMGNVDDICSSDFTLRQLASKVERPYNEVSQVINEMIGKNFNAFLGECRVKEACRRLSDVEQYGHLTIEAISSSVGFRSRTNFVAIFKKVTGLTPSEYQRTARLQDGAKSV